MTPRARKWWLIGGAVWLVCGVGPGAGLELWDRLDPTGAAGDWAFHTLSAGVGLGVLAAILILPSRRRWVWGSLALAWCFGWFFWLGFLDDGITAVYDWLVGRGTIKRPGGFFGGLDDQVSAVILLSTLITTVLLVGATRSRIVLLASLSMVTLIAASWLLEFDTPWLMYIWHPIIVGSLMLWAVPKRIHLFPAHACQSCGYDLRGLEVGTKCPECGSVRLISDPAPR